MLARGHRALIRWLSCSDHFNHERCIPFWTTLEVELAKHLNTKVIDFSLIPLPVKLHDFRLCILGVIVFLSVTVDALTMLWTVID